MYIMVEYDDLQKINVVVNDVIKLLDMMDKIQEHDEHKIQSVGCDTHDKHEIMRGNEKTEGMRKMYAIKPNVDDKLEDAFLDVTLLSSKMTTGGTPNIRVVSDHHGNVKKSFHKQKYV